MIEGYKQLLNAIELHKNLKEAAENEYSYNYKILYGNAPKELSGMQYSDMPKGNRNMKQTLRVIEDLQRWQHQYYLEDEQIKVLEAHKKAIDECIDKSDITIKVAQLRALGLTQMQVAELVERSPRQVQRIESKISNG